MRQCRAITCRTGVRRRMRRTYTERPEVYGHINQLWMEVELIENEINTQDRVVQDLGGLFAETQQIQRTVKKQDFALKV